MDFDEKLFEVEIDSEVVDNDIDNIDLYAERLIEDDDDGQYDDLLLE